MVAPDGPVEVVDDRPRRSRAGSLSYDRARVLVAVLAVLLAVSLLAAPLGAGLPAGSALRFIGRQYALTLVGPLLTCVLVLILARGRGSLHAATAAALPLTVSTVLSLLWSLSLGYGWTQSAPAQRLAAVPRSGRVSAVCRRHGGGGLGSVAAHVQPRRTLASPGAAPAIVAVLLIASTTAVVLSRLRPWSQLSYQDYLGDPGPSDATATAIEPATQCCVVHIGLHGARPLTSLAVLVAGIVLVVLALRIAPWPAGPALAVAVALQYGHTALRWLFHPGPLGQPAPADRLWAGWVAAAAALVLLATSLIWWRLGAPPPDSDPGPRPAAT